MRLGTRIFLCYVAILVVCFSYPVKWTLNTLRIRYLEGVEDSLADQANILAAWVSVQMKNGAFSTEELENVFTDVESRRLYAQIYSTLKTSVDMQIYITDESGRVVFDSDDPAHEGENYKDKWRDVRMTLSGQYGARATKKNKRDPESTVLHVAAPIMVDGQIKGVLTVAKPTTAINKLVSTALTRLELVFGLAGIFAVLLSLLVSFWMTKPIKRLTRYADDISNGKRPPFPKLGSSEIGEMGQSFERMQEALEGKRYVEGYVQTLTHEIKSPLSAIRGAAELLEEKMSPEQQARFLTNIRNEAGHIQDIVDRLLELSSLENRKGIEKMETFPASDLIRGVLDSKDAIVSRKGLHMMSQFPSDVMIQGEPFLLHQALSNLLQNAIDFSPSGGKIELSATSAENTFTVVIRDHGPGIPDYAVSKVFEKFFSLQRPDTGKKSTGLGLNFVREVALLHDGDVSLVNCPEGGLEASFSIFCPV